MSSPRERIPIRAACWSCTWEAVYRPGAQIPRFCPSCNHEGMSLHYDCWSPMITVRTWCGQCEDPEEHGCGSTVKRRRLTYMTRPVHIDMQAVGV